MSMPYRRLGRSGLKVSLLSLGSWVTFGPQLDGDLAVRCLEAAHEGGVNFFDNAESYASGESEAIMGRAFKLLGWARHEYVVSSKFFWGIHDAPNMRATLNRKYLMQAIDGSLDRFGLDFLDLVFCHRAGPGDADRGDRVGDVRDRQLEKGALLGYLRVVRRGDRRRHRDRRAPPSPQAGGGTASVQPPRAASRRKGVCRG